MEFDATRPIWHQLVEEFERRIVGAAWSPGERIPGVRDLAGELGVNPNTVQRALAELERRGLCRSERAVGRFVTEDAGRIARLRRDIASGAATTYVTHVRNLGLDKDAATTLVTDAWAATDTHDPREN